MTIPQSQINRWHFLKEANSINAANMARTIYKATGIELYELYDTLLATIREFLKNEHNESEQFRAEVAHDRIVELMLADIQSDFTKEDYLIFKKLVFKFRERLWHR